MEIDIKQTENQITVTLLGRLDTSTSREFEKTIQEVSELKQKKIVVDLKELQYISSSGLRVFLILQKHASKENIDLTLTNMNDMIMEIFSITGFNTLFTIE